MNVQIENRLSEIHPAIYNPMLNKFAEELRNIRSQIDSVFAIKTIDDLEAKTAASVQRSHLIKVKT